MLHSMWNLPGPGIEPMSPALAGRFSSTESPGKAPPSGIYDFVTSSPLECGLDLVTCLYSTEYSKTDRMSFLKLSYKKIVASDHSPCSLSSLLVLSEPSCHVKQPCGEAHMARRQYLHPTAYKNLRSSVQQPSRNSILPLTW